MRKEKPVNNHKMNILIKPCLRGRGGGGLAWGLEEVTSELERSVKLRTGGTKRSRRDKQESTEGL